MFRVGFHEIRHRCWVAELAPEWKTSPQQPTPNGRIEGAMDRWELRYTYVFCVEGADRSNSLVLMGSESLEEAWEWNKGVKMEARNILLVDGLRLVRQNACPTDD